ncbi:hypothetical protein NKI96_23970 [Mesorhizobium sp. M0292]|uniref:hypothetical protein n=1 Tax=Mesorhizobium sp. M0292 TaxID=2956929 RepID=UPI00333C4942
MQSLTNFLADLPNIMPRKARKLILEGDILVGGLRSDIHYRDSIFDLVVDIGPDAAAAVLAAYKAGQLPMQRGTKPEQAPRAEVYLEQSEVLRAQIAEKRRRAAAINDTSLLVEADLTDHRLVDSVFMANHGPGSGSMILAGIKVHKQISGYKTNSGKSTGWHVRFDWTGTDGKPRSSEVVPPEADNRRNDADRNWDLPE